MFAEPPRLIFDREEEEAATCRRRRQRSVGVGRKENYHHHQLDDDHLHYPRVKPALCGRPGNVYSNFVYVFTALLIGFASFGRTRVAPPAASHFWLADRVFALALFALGILSVVWHGSHYNRVQYYDLVTMDFCIAYCILRLLCMVPAKWNLLSLSGSGHLCSVVSCAFLLFLWIKRRESHGALDYLLAVTSYFYICP